MTHIVVINNKFNAQKVEEFKEKNKQCTVLMASEVENLGKSKKNFKLNLFIDC